MTYLRWAYQHNSWYLFVILAINLWGRNLSSSHIGWDWLLCCRGGCLVASIGGIVTWSGRGFISSDRLLWDYARIGVICCLLPSCPKRFVCLARLLRLWSCGSGGRNLIISSGNLCPSPTFIYYVVYVSNQQISKNSLVSIHLIFIHKIMI